MAAFLVGLAGLAAAASIIVLSICILSSRLSRRERPLPGDSLGEPRPVFVRRFV